MTIRWARFVIVLAGFCSASCLHITPLPDGSDGDGAGNGGGGSGGGGGGNARSVRLQASNVAPTVNEQVTFLCVATGTGNEPIAFHYEANSGRLIHQDGAAEASFIVDAADVGIELQISCSAEYADGQVVQSDQLAVIAS